MRRALVALGLVALALGTWRSFPVIDAAGPEAPGLRALLLDVSALTSRLRSGHGLWLRRLVRDEARAAAAAGEELVVVRYAAGVESLGTAAGEEWLARLEGRDGEVMLFEAPGEAGLGAEVDAAIALVEPELVLPGRASGRLVLVAGDRVGGPDPAVRLARLASEGVAVERRLLPAATRSDLALEAVHLPPAPAPGEPLAVRLDLCLVRSALDTALPTAELELHSARGVERRTADLALPTTESTPLRWSVSVPLGTTPEGWMEVRARVDLRASQGPALEDAIPENDIGVARTRSGDEAQVLVLTSPERQQLAHELVGAAGDWPGLALRVGSPADLTAGSAELDLVVALDVGPSALPLRWLEAFLASGGGLLFCGGWGALAGWDPEDRTGAASLLPLAPREEDARPRDVVFFVDGSGSMSGEPFDEVRRALAGLVPSVGRGDALYLQFFTGAPLEPVDLRGGEEGPARALERLFASRPPGGATAVLYSLEALAQAREGLRRDGLVFLLSDGRDDLAHDVEERAAAVLSRLTRSRSRLVVVAAGDTPDLELLGRLVPEEGRLHRADGTGDLGELFQREVFGRRLREGSLPIVPAAGTVLPESAELLEAWEGVELPVHARFLRCEARPGADTLWVSEEEGEPVLALWRVGAGLVAAWAAGPEVSWVPGASGGKGRGLLAPLLRRLARQREGLGPSLGLREGRLVLTSVPGGWPARVRARVVARPMQVDPGQDGLELPLGEVDLLAGGEGVLDPRGVRSAPVPAFLSRLVGARPLFAVLEDPGDDSLLGSVTLDLPVAPALLFPGRGQGLAGALEGLPEAGEGARDRPRRGPAPDAWLWLAAGALLLAGAALKGAVGGTAGLSEA